MTPRSADTCARLIETKGGLLASNLSGVHAGSQPADSTDSTSCSRSTEAPSAPERNQSRLCAAGRRRPLTSTQLSRSVWAPAASWATDLSPGSRPHRGRIYREETDRPLWLCSSRNQSADVIRETSVTPDSTSKLPPWSWNKRYQQRGQSTPLTVRGALVHLQLRSQALGLGGPEVYVRFLSKNSPTENILKRSCCT